MIERVQMKYLGLSLMIGEQDIEVRDERYRLIATEKTIARARLVCRGYRKETRRAA